MNAFAGWERGARGYLEVTGWDRDDYTRERVRIGYLIEADQTFRDETLSPAALVGIIIGTVAVIAFAIALMIVATWKKPENSSTGLIKSE
jgi:hypothetical protein